MRDIGEYRFCLQAPSVSRRPVALVVCLRWRDNGTESNASQGSSKAPGQSREAEQEDMSDAELQQRQGEWVRELVCACPEYESVHEQGAKLTTSNPEDQDGNVHPPAHSGAEQELADSTFLKDSTCTSTLAGVVVFCDQPCGLGNAP